MEVWIKNLFHIFHPQWKIHKGTRHQRLFSSVQPTMFFDPFECSIENFRHRYMVVRQYTTAAPKTICKHAYEAAIRLEGGEALECFL